MSFQNTPTQQKKQKISTAQDNWLCLDFRQNNQLNLILNKFRIIRLPVISTEGCDSPV